MSSVSREVKERYWKKKYDEAPEIECACGCGEKLKAVDMYGRPKTYINGHNNRKYDHADKHAHQKAWVRRNRNWANDRRARLQRERKIKLIELRGGQCAKCGTKYDGKNGAIFHFHHTDPEVKDFQIGNNINNKSWTDLQREAAKCDLLCSNCHLIEHQGEF